MSAVVERLARGIPDVFSAGNENYYVDTVPSYDIIDVLCDVLRHCDVQCDSIMRSDMANVFSKLVQRSSAAVMQLLSRGKTAGRVSRAVHKT
jgi:hypothetical protein